MKIAIIGTGYVGLVSGAVFSNMGHLVTCIDVDSVKIANLNNAQTDIYEPGLSEKIQNALLRKAISFSTSSDDASDAEVVFIAVGTPQTDRGSADLRFVYQALEDLKGVIKNNALIVIKSTVPPGTCASIAAFLQSRGFLNEVVMNPEFLREGSAISDFLNPERIVIGCSSMVAQNRMRKVYSNWSQFPFVVTDTATAEMIKYASNIFLATKVAFINEMADICQHIGADVSSLSYGLGLDSRIGPQFLKVGPGFGGSCFPKDINALIAFNKERRIDNKLLEAVLAANQQRKLTMVAKISDILEGSLRGKVIGVLGLSFKANTDDVRYSPAIAIIELLLEHGAVVCAFDPQAMSQAQKVLPGIAYATCAKDVFAGSDCVVLLTEWQQFGELNFPDLAKSMKSPVVIDLRNMLDVANLAGISYHKL
jgi:UDPglucose 6-dehydrogenase